MIWLLLALWLPAWAEEDEDSEEGSDHESVAVYHAPPVTLERTLDAEEVQIMPGSLGDPVRALVNLPGFQRVPLESGFLLVRGSGPGDTGVYLDGARQPLLFHLGGYTSVIHPGLVSVARFEAGTWSARYGGFTSGAVVLEPSPVPEVVDARVGINVVWSEALVRAPLGRGWGLWLGGRRSYLDTLLDAAFAFESEVPAFGDVQLRTANEHVAFTVVGLSDSLDFHMADCTATVYRRSLQAQGMGHTEVGAGEVQVAGWLSRSSSKVEHVYARDTESRQGGGLRASWSLDRGPWGLASGVVGEGTDWSLVSDLQAPHEGVFGRVDPWAEVETQRGRLYLRTGLRADTLLTPEQDPRVGLSPRASTSLRLSRSMALMAEAGRFHQAPSPRLWLGVVDGGEVPLERSDSVSLALALSRPRVAVDLAAYARRMRLAEVLDDGSGLQLQGRARGLELQARYRGDVWELRTLLAASRSDRRLDETSPWITWRYHQGLQGSIMASRPLDLGWWTSVRFRAATGYPLDPDALVAYDFVSSQHLRLDARPSGRLDPWYALDVKVGRTRHWRHFTLRAWLDIQNITDRRVPEPILTGILDTEPIYSLGLFVLPVFGVDGTWLPREVHHEE